MEIRWALVNEYLSFYLDARDAYAQGLTTLGRDLTAAADKVREGVTFTPAEVRIVRARMKD